VKYALTDVIEDLLGVPIPERSQNAMVRCPVHGDEHASMSVDLDRGLFVCFGCGIKGGLNTLSRIMDKDLNEGEVLLRSLDAAVTRGYEDPPDFTSLALNLHLQLRQHKPPTVVKYFLDKGLHGSVIDKFTLGWDPGHQRIAMPYFEDEVAVAVKYRYADGAKGNEKGGKRYIYNVNDIRAGAEAAILCEGESDVHATYSQLLANGLADRIKVVGFPGASASRSNWELYALEFLWVGKVYVAYDADEAGDRGAETPLAVMDKAVRARPTKGKDMAEHFLNGGTLLDVNISLVD
jgi:DNA primase